MPPRVRGRIHEAARRLLQAEAADGLDIARLQAELLFGAAAGWDRAQVIAAGADVPEYAVLSRFEALLMRRLAREPLAYILGRREFYRLDLEIGPGVLIPRPETETLVEAALAAVQERSGKGTPVRVADVGTGCGAIALAVATGAPHARVIATDTSETALGYARRNRDRLGLASRVEIVRGALLDPVDEAPDIVTANLPYVPTEEWERLPPEIHDWEPREAVDGGTDGLDVIRAFAGQLPGRLVAGTTVLLEVGAGQADAISDVLLGALRDTFAGSTARTHRDLGGIERVVEVRTDG